jgi:nucleoside-diphosphate-sugar epimerase
MGAGMKVLVTGNLGYVGSVLTPHLRRALPNAEIVGFDAGYFSTCLTGASSAPERVLDAQYFGDMREFPETLLRDVTAVVHLAAISNDPIGNVFGRVTEEVNGGATASLARLAKSAGVKKFVLASSCSVYGCAENKPRTEESEVAPLTAYARSKVDSENDLRTVAGPNFQITCLRFPTACGWSDRTRLDLVLNDFVASALVTGCIEVLSDGTPWRPLIDVRDMARAIEWALREPTDAFLLLNAGRSDCNFTVKQLASKVSEICGVPLKINANAAPDNRSYQVDFSRFERLAPRFVPRFTLDSVVNDLREGMPRIANLKDDFRNSPYVRLWQLRKLRQEGLLDENLRWTHLAD